MAIPVGLCSLLATALIAYLSIASNPLEMGQLHLFPGADKVAHVLMYFFLAAVYLADYCKFRLPHHTTTNVELAFTSCAIMVGLGLEVAQLLLPDTGRNFEIGDWFADIAGATIAFFLMKFKLMHYERKYLYREALHRSHKHHHHHRYQENDSNM